MMIRDARTVPKASPVTTPLKRADSPTWMPLTGMATPSRVTTVFASVVTAQPPLTPRFGRLLTSLIFATNETVCPAVVPGDGDGEGGGEGGGEGSGAGLRVGDGVGVVTLLSSPQPDAKRPTARSVASPRPRKMDFMCTSCRRPEFAPAASGADGGGAVVPRAGRLTAFALLFVG